MHEDNANELLAPFFAWLGRSLQDAMLLPTVLTMEGRDQ